MRLLRGVVLHLGEAERLQHRRHVHAEAAAQALLEAVPAAHRIVGERAHASTVPVGGRLLLVGAAERHPVAVRLQHRVQVVDAAQVVAQLGLADPHDERRRVERLVAVRLVLRLPARRLQAPGIVRCTVCHSATVTESLRSGNPLGLREEPEEAVHGALVALDREVAGAQRVGELAAVPDQRAEGVGVGLDDRVGVLGGAAVDLDRPVGDADVERVLAQPQLVAGAQVAGGVGVEERAEREDDRVGADGGVARGRTASAAAQVPSASTIGLSSRPQSVSS